VYLDLLVRGMSRIKDIPYNHYSLLATIEQLWGFGCLENACDFSNSQLMTKFFV
jgi:hypothetical protein